MAHAPLTDPYSLVRKAMAWGVHAFTATGAILGLLSIHAIYQEQFHLAFVFMAAAVFVDAVDGTFARLVQVKSVLPGFDGALLDNIIDFLNYVVVPALFLYQAGLLPAGIGWLAAAGIALASSYQFCQGDAKTADHCFKGFPSYWNITVFYLACLGFSPWVNLVIVFLLTILIFVPIKYLYPSRSYHYFRLTLTLTVIWGAMMLALLWQYPEPHPWLLYGSLLYTVYYVAASLQVTGKDWVRERKLRKAAQ